MFKVGDKAKGFKFDRDSYPSIGWDDCMDDVVGVVGKVEYIVGDSYSVHFEESDTHWEYPNDLWYLGKVEGPQAFNVGDKVIPSFQIGDRVKFKKSSIDSGMIDATEDDVFNISHVAPSSKDVWIEEHLGWWSTEHLEHVKESVMTNTGETMNNTEEQEIKWEVGQEVWCIVYGKGTVTDVDTQVEVKNENSYTNYYELDGRIYGAKNRTLFFSEPQITAELFPPKKPFTPTLKKGDTVVVNTYLGSICHRVNEETETHLDCDGQRYAKQKITSIFKLGEEIKFS